MLRTIMHMPLLHLVLYSNMASIRLTPPAYYNNVHRHRKMLNVGGGGIRYNCVQSAREKNLDHAHLSLKSCPFGTKSFLVQLLILEINFHMISHSQAYCSRNRHGSGCCWGTAPYPAGCWGGGGYNHTYIYNIILRAFLCHLCGAHSGLPQLKDSSTCTHIQLYALFGLNHRYLAFSPDPHLQLFNVMQAEKKFRLLM